MAGRIGRVRTEGWRAADQDPGGARQSVEDGMNEKPGVGYETTEGKREKVQADVVGVEKQIKA